jgi:Mrp family chromosome partitioning ATPase
MTRIALALPAGLEARIEAESLDHGHTIVTRATGAHQLAAVIEETRPDCAIMAAEPRYLTPRVMDVCDAVGVRALALVAGDVERRYAATLGLYETLPADSSWPEMESQLAGVRLESVDATTTVREPVGRGRAVVIAVWGPSGAPGRTTTAIGIAAELAALGHSVALADVDTHGASIAPTLGMLDEAPGFAAACRLAGNDGLSIAEFERISQRYESGAGGFWVLTGIGRPSRWPELSATRVAKTIQTARDWVDYVVLDMASSLENDEEISSDLLAPRRNAAAVTALREADRIVAVGAADPVGLSRFLRSYVDLVETAATTDVAVVMNRLRASAIGLNPGGQVVETLARFGGIESPVVLPYDRSAIDAAILSARTLVDAAPRSAIRVALRDFVASRIVPAEVRRTPARFGLARLRG